MYIPTYIFTLKLSPTFLWVSKFYVKLAIVVKNFKIAEGRRMTLKIFGLKVRFLISPPLRLRKIQIYSN